jgi:ribonuclease HI
MNRNINIFSDSSYSINCVTVWFPNWKKNGWVNSSKKPVENKDIIEEIIKMIDDRKLSGSETHFTWLKGHADDPGNVAADKLAVEGAEEARKVANSLAAQENGGR